MRSKIVEQVLGDKTVEERTALADKFKQEALLRISYTQEGFSVHKRKTNKILLDTLNKYRSWLAEEQIPKLDKTANFERITSYKAYIEILEELKNKLK